MYSKANTPASRSQINTEPTDSNTMEIETSRRDFLKVSATAAGGLTIGMSIPGCSNYRANEYRTDGSWSANAWLEITPENNVVFTLDRVEMGQGTMTGLTTLVGEELRVAPERIQVVFAGVANEYRNPDYGLQLTGGSNSLSSSWGQIREAAASAKVMLEQAAADVFSVPTDQVFAENLHCVNKRDGKKVTFGSLAKIASKGSVPAKVALTESKDFKYIGKQNNRVDALSKVNGEAQYGIDVVKEGMKYAVVIRSPFIGGELASFDKAQILKQKGVIAVVEIERGLAIVAEKYWQARKAATAANVSWQKPENMPESSQTILDLYKRAAEEDDGKSIVNVGDADKAFDSASEVVEFEYTAPFLAHATMEPMNCVARVSKGKAEIWTGTQAPDIARVAVAKVTDVSLNDVTIHNQFIGGGFGRRLSQDFVAEAAEIAFKTGEVIKLVWSREEDTQHDLYRPATYHRVKAALDDQKNVMAWSHQIVAPGIMDWYVWDASPAMFPWAPKFMYSTLGHAGLLTAGTPITPADHSPYEGADQLPYDFPSINVSHTKADAGVPISYWRSVGHSQNAFVVESFVSELADKVGVDELAFRKNLLKDSPRHLNVLMTAARKAGWGKPSEQNVYQGLAVHKSFGSYVAQVVDIKIEHNEVKLVKVVCVIDCGQVVNPDIVTMQMESGIIFGATAALYGEITIQDGQVQQSNFHDYPIMRMNQTPEMEVVIVESNEPPTGVGEPSVPPVAPAIASAVFKATGKRVRSLPVKLS